MIGGESVLGVTGAPFSGLGFNGAADGDRRRALEAEAAGQQGMGFNGAADGDRRRDEVLGLP